MISFGMSDKPSVRPQEYDERYYLENCGGSEFFHLYGPQVLKPQLAYVLSRSGIIPGMRVLDLGCGRGEMLLHIRRRGATGIGTDYAEPALVIAARVSDCPVLQCDAKALPFADNTFDQVLFVGVMDHLHDWELEACFREMARVLRPGGQVLIHTCCNRMYYKNWTYRVRRLFARYLKALGLSVREPSPPRSGEDEALHVNEHSGWSLRRFFRRIHWIARVEPRPNYKLCLDELYGQPLPQGFPLTPVLGWKRRAYLALLWRWPLRSFLAREFFCVAQPPAR